MPTIMLGASNPEIGKEEWPLPSGADCFRVTCYGKGNNSFWLPVQWQIDTNHRIHYTEWQSFSPLYIAVPLAQFVSFIWNLMSSRISSQCPWKQVLDKFCLGVETWVCYVCFCWLSAFCFGLIGAKCSKVQENEMTHPLPSQWGNTEKHLEKKAALELCVGTDVGLYIYGHHKALARSSHRKVLIWQYKDTVRRKTNTKQNERRNQWKLGLSSDAIGSFAPSGIWVFLVKSQTREMWVLAGCFGIICPALYRWEEEPSEKLAEITKPVCGRNVFSLWAKLHCNLL